MKDKLMSLTAEQLFAVKGLVTVVTGAASGLALISSVGVSSVIAPGSSSPSMLIVPRRNPSVKKTNKMTLNAA